MDSAVDTSVITLHVAATDSGQTSCQMKHPVEWQYGLENSVNSPLGTVRPLYRTGVSLLSRERFFYI